MRIGIMAGGCLYALLASTDALAQTVDPVVQGVSPANPAAQTSGTSQGPDAVAPDAAAPQAPGQATASAGARTEDIVVTAQRRSERLQDTPITVSAFTAATLEARGIQNTVDLSSVVPNFVLYRQATSVTPFLRGIGTKNSVVGDENAVATYVDGVYIASAAAGIFALNNIERVEVLRGPQGTLFGRNATAGVVQIVTRDPSDQASVSGAVGYGNYNTLEGTLYATGGLAKNVAADLAIYYNDQQDGYGRNLFTGDKVFFGHEFAARSKVKIDLARTTITLAGDYDYSVPVLPAIYRARPGFPLIGGTTYPGFYNVNVNFPERGHDGQWGVSARVEQEVGSAKLIGITSYRKVDAEVDFDADGTPQLRQQATVAQKSRTISQELQLQSGRGGALQWVLGLYYWHDRSGALPLDLNVGGTVFDRYAEQTTNSYAGFGQATLRIAPETNFTAGLRYTVDDRSVTSHDVRANGLVNNFVDQSVSFPKLTWRFALDHRFSPDVLVYAQYNRGFKSGVYNLFSPASAPVRPETLDTYEVGAKTDLFDRRVRFNTALFYNRFDQIQLQVPVVGLGTQLYNAAAGTSYGVETELDVVLSNRLRLSGGAAYLHSEYTSLPSAPYFTPLPGGGNAASTQDGSGNEFLIAPHWTGNLSATYTVPVSFGSLSLSADDAYNGGFYFDVQNRIRQGPYQLLNANVSLRTADKRYALTFWAKNLTATRYYINSVPSAFGDDSVPGAPRTYGARLSFKF